MSQENRKIPEPSLVVQLQQSCKIKKFDIKSIQTLGVIRPSQLESFRHIKIREESFKDLLNKQLKVCYLYEPIMSTLQQLSAKPNISSSQLRLEQPELQISHPNPNNFLPVNTILKILYENLFYRNMVKLKMDSYDTVINLVNNRSTEVNRKVIIAGLIAFVSKKLTLEEIGAAMLIFNLEEALLRMRPYGLPLQQLALQKCIKKIERLVNLNDLKNFILTVKQQAKNEPAPIIQQPHLQGYQNFLGPDQFLYLVSLSQKKSTSTSIFFHSFSKSQNKSLYARSQGIDAFMKQKKAEIMNGTDNSIKDGNKENKNGDQNSQSQPGLAQKSYQKIQGLSLHSHQQPYIKQTEANNDIYKEIKTYLIENRPKSAIKIHRKTKSLKLMTQMNKNVRPTTAVFKKSIQIIQKGSKEYFSIHESGESRGGHSGDKRNDSLKKSANKQIGHGVEKMGFRSRSHSITHASYAKLSSYHSKTQAIRPPSHFKTPSANSPSALLKKSGKKQKKLTIKNEKAYELKINNRRSGTEEEKLEWVQVEKGKVYYQYQE